MDHGLSHLLFFSILKKILKKFVQNSSFLRLNG